MTVLPPKLISHTLYDSQLNIYWRVHATLLFIYMLFSVTRSLVRQNITQRTSHVYQLQAKLKGSRTRSRLNFSVEGRKSISSFSRFNSIFRRCDISNRLKIVTQWKENMKLKEGEDSIKILYYDSE